MPKTKMVTMTVEAWKEKGKQLFGEDVLKWRFVCPSCGHIQTPEDFRPYKGEGATPDIAYFSCIGRYDGHGDTVMCSGKSPCNYTSGGLFNLAPVMVTDGDNKHYCFAFDESCEGNK